MFKLEINVDVTNLPDLTNPKIMDAAYTASKLLQSTIMEVVLESDNNAQTRKKAERIGIISLFKSSIFVEEIPNGYCHDYCCKHLPWYVITTDIGRFVVGWRKSVMSIDWTQTINTKTADELFPNIDVTKGERSIHAWSIKDAAVYINTIYEDVVTCVNKNNYCIAKDTLDASISDIKLP